MAGDNEDGVKQEKQVEKIEPVVEIAEDVLNSQEAKVGEAVSEVSEKVKKAVASVSIDGSPEDTAEIKEAADATQKEAEKDKEEYYEELRRNIPNFDDKAEVIKKEVEFNDEGKEDYQEMLKDIPNANDLAKSFSEENGAIGSNENINNESEGEIAAEEMKKLAFVENLIQKNYGSISKIIEGINEKFEIDLSLEGVSENNIREVCISFDRALIKGLELGSLIDKRIMAISVLLIPLAEKEIEVNEKIIAEGDLKYIDKIKIIAETFLSPDRQIDYDSMNEAGDYIDVAGDKIEGDNKRFVYKIFAKILKNKVFQEAVSEKFRQWLDINKNDGKSEEESIIEIIESELSETDTV